MKIILGFILALIVFNFNPTSVAYMAQYLNSLHSVVQDMVIKSLENLPAPKTPTKLENT
jgi:hypothetical protein